MSIPDPTPPAPSPGGDQTHHLTTAQLWQVYDLGRRCGAHRADAAYWRGVADGAAFQAQLDEPPAYCHPRGTRLRPLAGGRHA